MDEHAKAAKQFRKAVAANPLHGAAHFNLALSLEKSGRRELAIKAYAKALAVEPDHPLAARLAHLKQDKD